MLGLLTGVAAQAGDLVESALKRDAGVKDAGDMIVGHGGVLDRFDSYLFGGVAFFATLHLLGILQVQVTATCASELRFSARRDRSARKRST